MATAGQESSRAGQAEPRLGLAPGAGFAVESLGDLDTYLEAVAAAGFDAVSLSLGQLGGDPETAARLVRAHGLSCTDLLALRIGRDDEETMAQAMAMAPAVHALGAANVLTMFWTRLSPESVDRLARAADVVGVPLALEFAPGGSLDSLAAADGLVDELGSDRVAVLADTCHFFRGPSTLEMLEQIPLDHLAIVQFNDARPTLSEDYMTETMNRRAFPGEGELDLAGFASILRARGWHGVVSVEVLAEDTRRLPLEEFARRAYETTSSFWRP